MQVIERPEQLVYKNAVPFVVWCYWEGEPMTGNRLLSFQTLQQNIGVPICLVTPENLDNFLLSASPLPTSYAQLSIVHRSDYIRAYLLHHYGGAWHDIKATEVDYSSMWDLFADPNIWIIGRKESRKGAAQTYTPEGLFVPNAYESLIAVPSWIGRPQTALSRELLAGITALIDNKAELLTRFPSIHPRDKYIPHRNLLHKALIWVKHKYAGRQVGYPLEWTVFGNIFHVVLLKHLSHISYELPVDDKKNAGIYHRG